MCDDVSVNVCSVYFNIIKVLPTCFVWGISNQYYMVITLIFYNLYLYECIYISLISTFGYCMLTYVYLLLTNLLIFFDNTICLLICSE